MSMRTNRSESSMPRWRQFAPTAFLAVLGVVVSVVLFWTAYTWEMRSIRRGFDALADARCKEISNAIHETAKLLDFVDNIFMIAPRADSPTFAEYLRALNKLFGEDRSRHTEIRSLIWAPRVPRAELAAYERAAQAAFGSRFQIGKSGVSGNMDPAARRSEYFPVFLHIAAKPDNNLLGEDLSLDPAARDVMRRSQDTGDSLASAPMKMSAEAGGGLGYRIFQPLYSTDVVGETRDRRQSLAGFLCIDLDVGRLVDNAMMNIEPVGIDLRVCDDTDGNSVILCRHLSRLNSPSVAGDESLNELESIWTSEFFGRKVLILCRSSQAFWIGRTIWQPWVVLCGGLALTLVVAGYQFNHAFRARAVERAVNKRIAKLYKEIDRRQQAERLWDPNPSLVDLASGGLQGTAVAADIADDDSE